ncbi:MAG: hypothetical protein Harvfovirus9_24 [Harvfovirus sp.]|uniref:Uncharacterized protein n=1 Tax=Harvfovirus sp. TaxID=2487768 RepID=A0A3G5A315_9VIRU|nr:MAG: hypothetical protein Harvfovirus9_24 [Harvfovirus sp.]
MTSLEKRIHIASCPISVFPERLSPIFFASGRRILIVDFVNGRVISITGLWRINGIHWDAMEINRQENKININLKYQDENVDSVKIDLDRSMLIPQLLFPETTQTINKELGNGSTNYIWWYHHLLMTSTLLRTFTSKSEEQINKTAESTTGLIKLYPQTGNPKRQKSFCWHHIDYLYTGAFYNNNFHNVLRITHPLFKNICRYCLTKDNVLILFIESNLSYQLMFIDCDKLQIIGQCELPNNFSTSPSTPYFFTELKPTRKDFLTFKQRVVNLLTTRVLPPLAEIVFDYYFSDFLMC